MMPRPCTGEKGENTFTVAAKFNTCVCDVESLLLVFQKKGDNILTQHLLGQSFLHREATCDSFGLSLLLMFAFYSLL